MSATDLFEDDLLDLIFTNVNCPNVGDATGLQGSTTAGSHYISLHTGTLTNASSQQTDQETTYLNYQRQAVARSLAGWTVSNGTVNNDSAITYPQAGATGAGTVTFFGLGSASTGTGFLQLFGALTSSLAVSNGITPQFAAQAFNISID